MRQYFRAKKGLDHWSSPVFMQVFPNFHADSSREYFFQKFLSAFICGLIFQAK